MTGRKRTIGGVWVTPELKAASEAAAADAGVAAGAVIREVLHDYLAHPHWVPRYTPAPATAVRMSYDITPSLLQRVKDVASSRRSTVSDIIREGLMRRTCPPGTLPPPQSAPYPGPLTGTRWNRKNEPAVQIVILSDDDYRTGAATRALHWENTSSGHRYWITAEGLHRKYTPTEPTTTTREPGHQ